MKFWLGLLVFLLVSCPKALADPLVGPVPWGSSVFNKDTFVWPEYKVPLEDQDSQEDRPNPSGPKVDSNGRAYTIRIARVKYKGKWAWRCWQQYLDDPEPDLSKPYRY